MIEPLTPQPGESDREGAGVQLGALGWERIQLTMRLDIDSGQQEAFRVDQFALVPQGGGDPLAAMPGARADCAPGSQVVRFNVFAGPGRAPLAPGPWALAVRRADEWVPIPAGPGLDPRAWSRDFEYPGGMYRVGIRAEGAGRLATVHISVWQPSGRPGRWPFRSIRRGWRRLVRRVRQRSFGLLVGTLRLVLPSRRRRVVFTSDSRESLGGNLKLVHDRMVARGLNRRLSMETIFRPSIRVGRSLRDRLRMVWLFGSADVILLDDYQPAIYQLGTRQDVRIIQLWHAWGAFKTVGFSRIGKPGGPSPFSRVHRNYSYAIVSSSHEVPFYAEAFGIPEQQVIPTGTPRMDEFLDPARQAAGRARALAAVPAAADREVILFAPTFRGSGARRARYPTEMIDVERFHRLAVQRDAVVVFKMHPFVHRPLDIPPALADRLIDGGQADADINDLLLLADLLVTDYSSLVFEYAALGRPMLFYAFDLEEYTSTRDFYEPFEEFVPGRIVRSFGELLEAIERQEFDVEKVRPFAQRHLPSTSGSATDRIIDELILPS